MRIIECLLGAMCCPVQFWFSWRYQLKEMQKEYHAVAVDMRLVCCETTCSRVLEDHTASAMV